MPTADFTAEIAAITRIKSVPIILKMMKKMTGMRFAAVARVTDRHWITCAVDDSLLFGLKSGDELPLETTICNEIRQHHQPVIFGNVRLDEKYSEHHTPRIYGLESYISMPIILSDGSFFGTLCAIDNVAVDLNDDIVPTLKLFTELIASNLDLDTALNVTNGALVDANDKARLQDEFVAVLGHDLRTPLSAIKMSADFLSRKLADRQERRYALTILKSSERMGEMIENVLDFARGRLGGGIPISPLVTLDLQPALQNVINEIRATHPAALIEQILSIDQPVFCDVSRICQLFSNLLSNAVTHGSPSHPIMVRATLESTNVIISVSNQGQPISSALMPRLFQPFTRHGNGYRTEGLGLGLYIAWQIAHAHGGSLVAQSSAEAGTCLTATLPARAEET
jgi:signal transduction histidine kinase